jgi:hypothetical protein
LLLAGNFDYKLQTYITNFLGGRLSPYRNYGNRFQLEFWKMKRRGMDGV